MKLLSSLTAFLLLASYGFAAEQELLLRAVMSSDQTLLDKALAQGADADTADPSGTTALIWAAQRNDLASVKKLLTAGADAAAQNDYGAAAITEAARHGNAEMIEILLAAGADPALTPSDREYPLLVAARAGNPDAVRLLLEAGVPVDTQEPWRKQTALMWAADANRAEVVKLLIGHGASVDARSQVWNKERKKEDGNLVTRPPKGGLTPLLYAARRGASEAVEVLIEAGADLNLSDPDGMSPTVMAVINAHYDTAALLIEAGADPNVADFTGRAVLYAALDMYTLEPSVTRPEPDYDDLHTGLDIARLALEHGANVDARLKEPILLRGTSDNPDPILKAGTTPFIRAAKTGDVESMKLLLEFGADPMAITDDGVTALMAAAGMGWRYGDSVVPEDASLQAVRLCLELGVPLNASTVEKEETALHGAADRGAENIVALLVKSGADVDAQSTDGYTALDYAEGIGTRGHPGHPGTAAVLRSYSQVAAAMAEEKGAIH